MSIVFALVLLGCADDGSACQKLAAQPDHYASEKLCKASQEGALESDVAMRADHPLVMSRCVRVNTASLAKSRVKLATRD